MNELLASGEAKEMIGVVAFWVKCRIYGAIIANAVIIAGLIYFGVRYRGTVKKWFREMFK